MKFFRVGTMEARIAKPISIWVTEVDSGRPSRVGLLEERATWR
jgi:hypothetical protein